MRARSASRGPGASRPRDRAERGRAPGPRSQFELKPHRLAAALVSAALLVAAGCSRPTGPVDAGAPREPSARGGVKVPLTAGWHAEVGPEQSLLVGPPGRPVLRVDLRPGAGSELPSAEALERAFAAGLVDTRIERERVLDRADFVGLRLSLTTAEDGGEHAHQAFIGAKRIGPDLFLCATLPHASRGELDDAERSCAELSWSKAR